VHGGEDNRVEKATHVLKGVPTRGVSYRGMELAKCGSSMRTQALQKPLPFDRLVRLTLADP
jgi:hypothetical protein